MSEVTVGLLNAGMAFHNPGDPSAQTAILDFIGGLPDKPPLLLVNEFTGPEVTVLDVAYIAGQLASRGYELAAMSNNGEPAKAGNASTVAALRRSDVEPGHIKMSMQTFGSRNGLVAKYLGGAKVVDVHSPDDHETKRIRTIGGILGAFAVAAAGVRVAEQTKERPLEQLIVTADFNATSLKDDHPQTRLLRWLGRRTSIGDIQVDFYKHNLITRPLGFLVRAIRMADGRSRGMLETMGMRNANTNYDPTCFHGPHGAFQLALDDVYMSPDGQVTAFTKHAPIDAKGHRISDHDLLITTIQFADR